MSALRTWYNSVSVADAFKFALQTCLWAKRCPKLWYNVHRVPVLRTYGDGVHCSVGKFYAWRITVAKRK